ncbi:NAD-P-binding protein [Peniophora sp. CONT]|nr:NAD-P-binding protein [Peniophora sp. CONT]
MSDPTSIPEANIFTAVHDVYPLIDPTPHFASKTFKDQVVLIAGGSTGIGATTALFYAKAGAKVVILARRFGKLEETKKSIEKEVKGAQVLVFTGDISDPEVGKRAVKTTVETWGKLDIVLANQFTLLAGPDTRLADKDPVVWWNTQVVNVRGTLNIVHASIPELLKSKGQIIVTSSSAAHFRIPAFLDYSVSKHALNRFVEILALDYPELFVTAVHPGAISTPGSEDAMDSMGLAGIQLPDTVELPAATFLWLTARNAEFLSGRYIQATWDLNEVLDKRDEIIKDNLLVTKLAGPVRSM